MMKNTCNAKYLCNIYQFLRYQLINTCFYLGCNKTNVLYATTTINHLVKKFLNCVIVDEPKYTGNTAGIRYQRVLC